MTDLSIKKACHHWMVLSMFYESKCVLYVAECASINCQAQSNMFALGSSL